MMAAALPWWWLALPVLLLPLWWHRQKRRQLKAVPLASARFLPPADPHQLRAWAWSDRILLLVRCLLLVTLIAWLAGGVLAWRGDTVLVDAGVDQVWAARQIAAAGFKDAARRSFCVAAAPAATVANAAHADACEIATPSLLDWLGAHEHAWRPKARLLVVAGAASLAMPARPPQLAHQIEWRIQAAAPAKAGTPHQVVLASTPERAAAWRALFAAFDSAGDASRKYLVADAPTAPTEIIVWDRPGAPPPQWRAPLWWVGASAGLPELVGAPALSVNGFTLRQADSPRGRLWRLDAPRDADGARAIFDAWQALQAVPQAYPMPAQTLAPHKAASPLPRDAAPEPWLLVLLLALFCLERILTHARRN